MEELRTIKQDISILDGVHCYLTTDGTVYLNLEDVARGLGFTTVATSGNDVVRWSRVRKYLNEFGVSACGDGDYIPEQIFYKLAMKANNDVAKTFQDKIAYEILPSIRKHGAYMTEQTLEEALTNPDFLIKLATELKAEQEKRKHLEAHNLRLAVDNQIMQPKAEYYDMILRSKSLVAISQIAKDYGMSANEMNSMLHEFGIQYKQNGQWLLYRKYDKEGYVHSETFNFKHKDGKADVKMLTKWTQKGRLFLYDLLKKNDIVPVIEKENIMQKKSTCI